MEFKPKRWNLFVGILQIICATIFTLLLILLYIFFGGEFLIIAENLWAILVFAIIFYGSAFYGGTCILLSYFTGKRWGFKWKKVSGNKYWVSIWSILNVIIGVLLFIVYGFLFILLADFLTGELFILIFVIAIPFIGLGSILMADAIKVFNRLIQRLKKVHMSPGLTGISISILFLLISFGLILAFYNPKWTPGVEYHNLFTTDEQPGRGYRIPSIIVLPNNILLAFSESRADPMLDWGDIDLVMKRSTDGGINWGPIQILRDEGSHTAGNPCPVFDKNTNMTWLPFCVDNKKVFVMNSSDFGVTWSEPREITGDLNLNLSGSTDQLSLEYGTGPGIGIQLTSGRLVIPSYYFDSRGSHVIFSDDGGITWEKGDNLNFGGECQIFEAVNGSLCINCRTTEQYRYIAWSNDGGETWIPGKYDNELAVTPVMASIIRFTDNTTHSRNRIIFSSPYQWGRGHLTLRISYDEGSNWNISKEVYSGPAAYSQLAILSNKTILILFEQGTLDYRESIVLARITLDWLTDGTDSISI
jgi:sialidase-1